MVLNQSQKAKMVSQGNNNNVPKFNDPFIKNSPPQEEALVDQPDLSPHVHSFINNPYNQDMMEKFFKHNANRLVAELIAQGECLPPKFDKSILDKPLIGDLANNFILHSLLHPQPTTFAPATSIAPRTSNLPRSPIPP